MQNAKAVFVIAAAFLLFAVTANAAADKNKPPVDIVKFPFGVGSKYEAIKNSLPETAEKLDYSTENIEIIAVKPESLYILSDKMNFPPKQVFYIIHKKHGLVGVWIDIHYYDETINPNAIAGFARAATEQLKNLTGKEPDINELQLQKIKPGEMPPKEHLISCLFHHTSRKAAGLIDEKTEEKHLWNPAAGCNSNQCKIMSGWKLEDSAAKKKKISNISSSTVAYTHDSATASIYLDYILNLSAEELQEYQLTVENIVKSKFPAAAK